MASEVILILDFGGQYKELIARRVRECNVYSIVKNGEITVDEIRKISPIGIIFTGGPNSVYLEDSMHCDKAILEMGIPVLGICYGSQLLAWTKGGNVSPCEKSEYGRTLMHVDTASDLFYGMDPEQIGLMSHTDQITKLPKGFKKTASTADCPIAALENKKEKLSSGEPEAEKKKRSVLLPFGNR